MKRSIQDSLFRLTAALLGGATLGSALWFTMLGSSIVTTANQTAQQPSLIKEQSDDTNLS
jgi:hypothetical protein